ncbi:MAG: extracellular solute-binding protein [Lachnospiraceae bacterium]
MRVKQLGAAVLATVMVLGCFSGCSSQKDNENGTTNGNAGSNDVVELTFYNADGKEDPWTDPVALALTEATGVKLKTEYPVGSDQNRISLMIAEGKYPDMIYAKGDAASLIEAGILIDMTDLIEEYGPHIKAMYGDEFEKLKYSEEDPSIYQLSSYAMGGITYESSGTAQIQWDVLKENDYKVPDTLEEFETMIKDYMEAHPQTEDGLDTIGLSMSVADWHWMITLGNPAGYIAAGAPDNGEYLIREDGTAVYKYSDEKVREYFKWLNRMYNEGVLDPEFATQTHEDYIAKIASGRVLALTDTDWDYSDGEKVLISDGKLGKTYAGLPLTMDADTKCASLMYQGLTTGQGVAITTSCKDPVAAIKFLDYLCSDEGQVLVNWGIEGVNYFIDDEGHRYRTQEEIDEANSNSDYAKTTGVGFHTYPFPCYGSGVEDSTGSTYTTTSKDNVIAEYNEEEKAACAAWNVELLVDIFPQSNEFEVPEYSPVWAYTMPDAYTNMYKKMEEITWSQLVACIMTSEDSFDASYDAMLTALEKEGMSEVEQMVTDAIQERINIVENN